MSLQETLKRLEEEENRKVERSDIPNGSSTLNRAKQIHTSNAEPDDEWNEDEIDEEDPPHLLNLELEQDTELVVPESSIPLIPVGKEMEMMLSNIPAERNSSSEENVISMVKLLQKNHIRHLFRFTTDEVKPCGKPYDDYPKSTDKCCVICQRKIEGIPIFTPLRLDKLRKVYILIKEPHCSLRHCKLSIIFGGRSNMGQQLALLSSFARNFLGLSETSTITSIPLSAMTKCSEFGYMSEEEYYDEHKKVNVTHLEPPAIFVPTGLQEIDIKERERQRREQFDRIHSLKAAPDQQLKYKQTIERVVMEKKKKPNVTESPFSTPSGSKSGVERVPAKNTHQLLPKPVSQKPPSKQTGKAVRGKAKSVIPPGTNIIQRLQSNTTQPKK